MRFSTSKGFLASLAVAGALVGGLLLSPASAQQGNTGDKKPANITISGTALNPDGSPAAKLPVHIKGIEKHGMQAGGGEGGGGDGAGAPPPDLLSQGAQGKGAKGGGKAKGEGGLYKTLGKGVTDESGKFSVKVTTLGQGDHTVMVEIGEAGKTNFMRKTVPTQGKDLDLGNVTLTAPAKAG